MTSFRCIPHVPSVPYVSSVTLLALHWLETPLYISKLFCVQFHTFMLQLCLFLRPEAELPVIECPRALHVDTYELMAVRFPLPWTLCHH